MGVPASRLKCRLKRYATLGVSTEDQPLIESCCEVVPTEALKPLTTGMMPAGPLSLVVAAAVTPPNSSSKLSGVAWAWPQRGNAGNRHIETNQGSREPRTNCEWNKGIHLSAAGQHICPTKCTPGSRWPAPRECA